MIQEVIIFYKEEKLLIDKTLLGVDKGFYSLHDSLLKELSIDFFYKKITLLIELYLEKII